MYEASRTDFKPAEGELPDTLARFNLDEVKVKNKKFGNNDILTVGMVLTLLFAGMLLNLVSNSDRERKEDEKKLATETKTVNQAVTTLDKTDVVEASKAINQAYTADADLGAAGVYSPNMSQAEKLLKKKTPHIEVFDPDEDN